MFLLVKGRVKVKIRWSYSHIFEEKNPMISSINPYNGETIEQHETYSWKETEMAITRSDEAFHTWKKRPINDRSLLFNKLAGLLKTKKKELGELITREMGKVLRESVAEIEKCAWLCDYYAENGPAMLESESAPSDGTISYIQFDPIGVIYAIMPWNFPFWQVLRFAVPTILAGNTVVLKHAPNVWCCSKEIDRLFREAGFPEHVFSNLFIPVDMSENVIGHPLIQGVTLTGSQAAGRAVASQAGKYLKKTVLELGGSDPFILLADAEFKPACETAVNSRMMNAGQVCIAAKRFIVEEPLIQKFTAEIKSRLEQLRMGDPMDENTDIGPMARPDLLQNIDDQVQRSIKKGARLLTGGRIEEDRFYTPTLLAQVSKGMPVYDEETFGPVTVIIAARDAEDALEIANDSNFGLGASIWTTNLELAEKMATEVNAGAVFINGMVKSDPRLPFGGTRRSGYGRELSHFGIREFTNIKTVWFK